MHSSENKAKLPLTIRILVGMAGLPSIVIWGQSKLYPVRGLTTLP
jgi:hypothetical protein